MNLNLETSLPESYIQAEWRGTNPVSPNGRFIGMSLALPNQPELRLALHVEDAANLAETLALYLTKVQSAKSSGSPAVDESMPPGSE